MAAVIVAGAVANRLLQGVLLLVVSSAVAFFLLRAAPGDPAAGIYGTAATSDQIASVRALWRLDDPVLVQYLEWMRGLLSGDLGRSYLDGRPVQAVIAARIPATLLLAGTALLLALSAGIPLGVLSTVGSRPWQRTASLLATAFYSTPAFWLGMILVLLIPLRLGLLPAGGMVTPGRPPSATDLLAHLVLPATVLALRDTGRFARLTRASMLVVLAQDFVRTARAKGLPERVVAVRHVFRSSIPPIIAAVGVGIPGLLGGSVVVETVFAWPGMGRLAIESALARDYPVLMGEVVLVTAVAYLSGLGADLISAAIDPRLRHRPGEV